MRWQIENHSPTVLKNLYEDFSKSLNFWEEPGDFFIMFYKNEKEFYECVIIMLMYFRNNQWMAMD